MWSIPLLQSPNLLFPLEKLRALCTAMILSKRKRAVKELYLSEHMYNPDKQIQVSKISFGLLTPES